MADFIEQANDPKPADPARLFEYAINNLSLGLIIFDSKRKVVFCNQQYAEIYRLSSEQTKPGTAISELVEHRLNLGLKVLSRPDAHIRERVANASLQARPSLNSPMAGSYPIRSIRCRTAAGWPPMRTSPTGRN